MQKTTLRCKTITPVFMTGTNKERPELRAPSIKGVMRYIWRAVQVSDDIQNMRKKEGKLFGQAADNGSSSQIRLQVIIHSQEYRGKSSLLPHRREPEYNGKNKNKTFPVCAVKENTEFDVIIRSNGSRTNKGKHEMFVRLFIVTAMLTGFGKRARKGMGAVMIKSIEGIGEELEYDWNSLAAHLIEISSCNWRRNNNIITPLSRDPKSKYPYIRSIKREKAKENSGEQMVKKIGLILHELRNGDKKRYVFLGSGRPRFASSVLMSPAVLEGGCYCIITEMKYTKYIPDYDAHNCEMKDFNQKLRERI